MKQVFAIAIGGACGSVLRFWISAWAAAFFGRAFPYGTMLVNVAGSLAIGLLYVLLIERLALAAEWRAALLVGLLGGFTTFSTFSLETVNLVIEGEQIKALLNVVGSVVICIGATWLGIISGRQL